MVAFRSSRSGTSRVAANRIAPALPLALSAKRPKNQSESSSQPHILTLHEPVLQPDLSIPPADAPIPPDASSVEAVEVQRRGSIGSQAADLSNSAVKDDVSVSQLESRDNPAGEALMIQSPETIEIQLSSEIEPVTAPPTPNNSHKPQDTLQSSLPRTLPPPFYPAQRLESPSQYESVESQPVMHPAQFQSSNIIFGGYRDSGTSSPAPPPNGQYPKPLPTALPNQMYPFHPNGPYYPQPSLHGTSAHSQPAFHPYGNHSALPRELGGQAAFHHYPNPRPFPGHDGRFPGFVHHQRPPLPPSAYPAYFPPPPRSPFPVGEPLDGHQPRTTQGSPSVVNAFAPPFSASNGTMRESKQHSSHEHRHSEEPNSVTLKNKHFSNPDDLDKGVADYVQGQLGNVEFADYILDITHAGTMFHSASLPAHGIFLGRSRKLRSLMKMQHEDLAHPSTYPRVLNVHIADKFLVTDSTFFEAVARLYDRPLLTNITIESLITPQGVQDLNLSLSALRMRTALSYAAAGFFLQLDDVISRALNIVADVMDWNNVGEALAFALDGGFGTAWYASEAVDEDDSTTSSQEDAAAKVESASASPTYGIYSDRLLSHIMEFTTSRIPASFRFSPRAAQFASTPRLPTCAEPHHSMPDSRLSHIRFGSITVEEHSRPDSDMLALSSLLISLPFHLLKHLLEHPEMGQRIGLATVNELAKAVIQERESRRQRASNVRKVHASASGTEEILWATVDWVERIEPCQRNPPGFRIMRRHLDVATPPSSRSNKSSENYHT